ncbi:MAG: rhomboid family intramembrane serine protease [Flavobacteriaceae bacterium]|nr:rhomboid family intramembrane serine protease [Flavobacteriaceae bacterium]
MGRLTEAIKHLLIINVLFYVVTYFVPNMQEKMFELFALFYPTSDFFKPWQFVSHMFMHGNTIHIIFNMYALWAFGSPLEQMWGRNKFLFFYFSAGLGAALIYTLANYYMQTFDAIAVGASGAVYGILVAFGMKFPNAKLALIFLPIPIAAKYFIPLILFGDIFFGFTSYSVGNIAHFAHIGGALIGFIIMMYWRQNQFKRWDK